MSATTATVKFTADKIDGTWVVLRKTEGETPAVVFEGKTRDEVRAEARTRNAALAEEAEDMAADDNVEADWAEADDWDRQEEQAEAERLAAEDAARTEDDRLQAELAAEHAQVENAAAAEHAQSLAEATDVQVVELDGELWDQATAATKAPAKAPKAPKAELGETVNARQLEEGHRITLRGVGVVTIAWKERAATKQKYTVHYTDGTGAEGVVELWANSRYRLVAA